MDGGDTAYFRYDRGYVIDNDVPGRGARVLVRWAGAPADRDTPGLVLAAIVGPDVAAVRAGVYGTFKAEHVNGLPRAYKAVVFYYPAWPALASERAQRGRTSHDSYAPGRTRWRSCHGSYH